MGLKENIVWYKMKITNWHYARGSVLLYDIISNQYGAHQSKFFSYDWTGWIEICV